jgi:hypothetical protein
VSGRPADQDFLTGMVDEARRGIASRIITASPQLLARETVVAGVTTFGQASVNNNLVADDQW